MTKSIWLAVALLPLALGCTRGYELTVSKSFRAYEDSHELKLVTADGVMVKVREIENYPEASLDFWADALGQHLENQGYAKKSSTCFQATSGLRGCTLDFLLPHGAEDWVLSETLFVSGDTVYLVEAAGPFERFAKVEKEFYASLLTFRLKR
jgi:hypothetical protein